MTAPYTENIVTLTYYIVMFVPYDLFTLNGVSGRHGHNDVSVVLI